MKDGSSLADIGFDPYFEAQSETLDGGRVPARIAVSHGESYIAWTAHGPRKAVIVGRRLATWRAAADRPAVGDWVTGTPDATGTLLIEHLLVRRTCLVRRAAGEREEAQVIAANVDLVGIVSALGDGTDGERERRLVNEHRLRRYLAAVEQSGAAPLLIVNKSDLSPAADEVVERLRRSFPTVPTVATSSRGDDGLAGLATWLEPRRTFALVGMSGVGKSTLVNALLGRSAQRTAEVRTRDARGRHTTTHRELFLTESGALLIDTPGMREMGLWEVEADAGFDDILALAATCRFSDCRHASEPGCAVLSALGDGSLSDERWNLYRRNELKSQGDRTIPRSLQPSSGRRRRPP